MNKKPAFIEDDDPLDQEIDFRNVRPNPFAARYGRNRNLRVLSPDLLERFPDSDSVDEALRAFIRLTSSAPPKKVSAKTAAVPKTKKTK
ncbi:MAG TPA: hypothetical protein VHY33_05445 [Thermoanaerobaculia bacterium]|jgi:hypothetical protein|nr:hypothetical protein [Thermoanaerobaculia bacterium]